MKAFIHKAFSLVGLCTAYVAVLCVWFSVRLIFGEPGVLMIVLNRAAPWLFLPAGLILLYSVYKRQWKLATLQVVPTALFAYLFAPYLLPQSGNDPTPYGDSASLQVMSYNVGNENSGYDGIVANIISLKPDIICFQELTPSGANELVSSLETHYPWRHVGIPVEGGTTAIFSSVRPEKFSNVSLPPGRPAVFMTVNGAAPGDAEPSYFTVASAHLHSYQLRNVPVASYANYIREQTAAQHRQARRLAYEIIRRKHPVVLGCDANTKDTCYTYKVLSQQLGDAARETGWRIGDSLPPGTAQDTRISRLEYLFYTRQSVRPWNVYRVKNTGGSDHQPVLGIFSIDGLHSVVRQANDDGIAAN
jgi:vancomycin resistance protein VanJ